MEGLLEPLLNEALVAVGCCPEGLKMGFQYGFLLMECKACEMRLLGGTEHKTGALMSPLGKENMTNNITGGSEMLTFEITPCSKAVILKAGSLDQQHQHYWEHVSSTDAQTSPLTISSSGMGPSLQHFGIASGNSDAHLSLRTTQHSTVSKKRGCYLPTG